MIKENKKEREKKQKKEQLKKKVKVIKLTQEKANGKKLKKEKENQMKHSRTFRGNSHL